MIDTAVKLPLVSIVIPAFNHADYLEEAIDSVLAQNYQNLELIVINDGSTDHTHDLLNTIQGDFYWESQDNIGQSQTLNRGWEMSGGDILAYLSADDVLAPDAVSASVAALSANPNAIAVYCDFNLLDPGSRIVKTIKLPEFDYDTMLKRVWCPIGPGAFFYREAYLKAGNWNPALQEMPDYDFWLRLGLFGQFQHLPKVLAGFRVHESSTSFSISTPQRANEPVLVISNLLHQPEAKSFDKALKSTAMASANMVSAQLHLRAGRFSEALRNIKQAWRCSKVTLLAPRTLHLIANALFKRTWYKLLWTMRNIFGKKSSD